MTASLAAARAAARAGARLRSVRVGPRPPLPLALAGAAVAVLALVPLGYLVLRAAGAADGPLDLVLRPRTLEVVANTLVMALLVGAGAVALGLPLGWATARTDLPFRRVLAVLVVVPLAIPSYVLAFAAAATMGPAGTLADLLAPFGIAGIPELRGLPGAVVVLVLATYPYVVLAVRAAVARLDPALLEAARTLGADEGAALRRVALPALLPAVAGGTLLAVLYALADFGSVSLVGFDSLSRAIHVQYRAAFDRSLAAVLALLLAGLALAVAVAEARIRARRPPALARTRARPMPVVALGRWRLPALALAAGVVLVALGLPLVTLAGWLARGLAAAGGSGAAPGGGGAALLEELAGATAGTLLAGGASVVATLALAAPVALLVARFPGRLATLVERAVLGAYALPGIVVALAVVFVATGLVPFLYQTLALLALAYAVRSLPQAAGPLRDGLRAVGPGLEEAARVLGRSPVGAFRAVTLPLLRPGIVAGSALVLLTTAKELPMTLLLAPTGVSTLATRVWGAVADGYYARAAPSALLLVAVSLVSVALLLRGEEAS